MALNFAINAQDYINSLHNPDDIVHFRLIHDKDKTKQAYNVDVEAAKYSTVEETLAKRNSQGYGVFAVVNNGGRSDSDITEVTAQFTEMDDKSFDKQMELIKKFPLPPSIIVKTRKSYHVYWIMK